MRTLDASSALYAWDNYPIAQFPPVWAWIAEEIQSGALTIPSVALAEVGDKAPDCAAWLKSRGIVELPMTEPILMKALEIKGLLGIVGDQYGSGVGENDLLIIAAARANGATIVTDEARQPSLPANPRNYKIPAVCDLPEVQVASTSFVSYLKGSQKVFA